MLALRLNRPGDRGVQEPASIVPVEVSESGAASYQLYDVAHGWRSPQPSHGTAIQFMPVRRPISS